MKTQTPNHPPNAPDPLAVALAKLDPSPHGFDWNALMFAAGRASKARALVFWKIMAGACAVAACGFALAFFLRPPVVVERPHTVYIDRVPPAPIQAEIQPTPVPTQSAGWSLEPPEQGAATRWLNTRNEVLTRGLGALPDPAPKVPPPPGADR